MYPPPLDRKPGVQTSKSWPGDKTVDDSVVTIKCMNHTIQFRKGANLFQVPSQTPSELHSSKVTERELKQALKIDVDSPRERAHTVVQRSRSDNPDNARATRPKSAICVTVDVHPPPVPKRQNMEQSSSSRQHKYTTGVKSPDSLPRHNRSCVEQHSPQRKIKQNCPVHGHQSRSNAAIEDVPNYVRKAKYYGYTEQQLEYWTQRHAKREEKKSRTFDRNVSSSDGVFDQSSAFVSGKIEQLKQEMRRAQLTQNSPRRVASDKTQQHSQEKQSLDQEQRTLPRRKSTGAILKEGSDFVDLDHLPDYTAIEQQQYWTQRRRKQMVEKKKNFPEILNKLNKEMQTKSELERKCNVFDNSEKSKGQLKSPVLRRSSVDDSHQIKEDQQKQQERKIENDLLPQRIPRCKSTPCDGRITRTNDGDCMAIVKSNDGTVPQQIFYIKEKESVFKGLSGSTKSECKTGMSKWVYKGNSKSKTSNEGNSSEIPKGNTEPVYCEMNAGNEAVLQQRNDSGKYENMHPLPINAKYAVEYESMIKVIKKKSASVPREAKLTPERENKSVKDSFGTFGKSSGVEDVLDGEYACIPEKTHSFTGLEHSEGRTKLPGVDLSKDIQYNQINQSSDEKCNDYANFPEYPLNHCPNKEYFTDLDRVTADRTTLPLSFHKGSLNDNYEICAKGILKNGTFPRGDDSIYDQFVSSMNCKNGLNLPPKTADSRTTSYQCKSAFSYSDYENDDEYDDDSCDDNSDDDCEIVWDDSEDTR